MYVDNDVSGTIPPDKRPSSSRLLAALTPKPPFHVLIVMEQSRLARDLARVLDLIETLEGAGVEVYSYQTGRPHLAR